MEMGGASAQRIQIDANEITTSAQPSVSQINTEGGLIVSVYQGVVDRVH